MIINNIQNWATLMAWIDTENSIINILGFELEDIRFWDNTVDEIISSGDIYSLHEKSNI